MNNYADNVIDIHTAVLDNITVCEHCWCHSLSVSATIRKSHLWLQDYNTKWIHRGTDQISGDKHVSKTLATVTFICWCYTCTKHVYG